MMRAYKKGFTLAEVLITLGIIGVVAVLTTSIINNYLGNPYLKKARIMYMDFLRCYRSVESELGPVENWSLSENLPHSIQNSFPVQYFAPRLHTKKICLSGDNTCSANNLPQPSGISFLTENGSVWNFMTYNFGFWVIEMDVNGNDGPNALGVDKFFFALNNHGIDAYTNSPYKDIQGIIIPGQESDNPSCTRQTPGSFAHWNLVINAGPPGNECLAVLIKNDWRADKYPIKDFSNN